MKKERKIKRGKKEERKMKILERRKYFEIYMKRNEWPNNVCKKKKKKKKEK